MWYCVDGARGRAAPVDSRASIPNLNAGDPTKTPYVAGSDRARCRAPRAGGSYVVRLTYQASPRNKFNIHWDEQHPVQRRDVGTSERRLPQSAGVRSSLSVPLGPGRPSARRPTSPGDRRLSRTTHPRVRQADMVVADDEPAAARGGLRRLSGAVRSVREPGQPDARPSRASPSSARPAARPTAASRTSPTARRTGDTAGTPQSTWRASVSYVTGAHNLKIGYGGVPGRPISRTITQRSQPRPTASTTACRTSSRRACCRSPRASHALHGASTCRTVDARTHDAAGRAALRSHTGAISPEQQIGGRRASCRRRSRFRRRRASTGYKDLTPRGGIAYDVFGNGKTSLKVNFGRYLEPTQQQQQLHPVEPDRRASRTTAPRDVDRRQQQLRARLRSDEPARAETDGDRRRHLRRR